MTAVLKLRIGRRAAVQIEEADRWWTENRRAAPGAFREDLDLRPDGSDPDLKRRDLGLDGSDLVPGRCDLGLEGSDLGPGRCDLGPEGSDLCPGSRDLVWAARIWVPVVATWVRVARTWVPVVATWVQTARTSVCHPQNRPRGSNPEAAEPQSVQWSVSVQVGFAVRQWQQVAVQFCVSEQFTAVWEE